jgi:hypothetical protein
MALLPRDAVETILAGQCVMFDHLLRDATHDLLRNGAEPIKRRIRSQVTALGRLFLKHLEQLWQLQARPLQQTAASPHAEPEASPDPVRHMARTAAVDPASVAGEAPTTNAEPLAEQSFSAGEEPASDVSQPRGGKVDLLVQRGFQNRRMRRALQFKKPAGKAAARRPAEQGTATQPTTGIPSSA